MFSVDTVDDTVRQFETFFRKINTPVRLSETSYGSYDKKDILAVMKHNRVGGTHHKLTEEDHAGLLELMW